MFRSSLSTAVLATLILKIAAAPSKSDLFVQTSSGPVVGFYNDTAPDVRQFLGIPFAEPPLGDLRFAPPQDKRPNGTIQATKFPPSCMQQFSNGKTVYTEYSQNFLINGGDSEDCLYVSVWTPKSEVIANQQRPLPVFLYIPGGGYTSGGQDSLYKIPDKWIQRTQSHIVVIMNYRVNLFGWPNAKALDDQNLGFLDQRKAVEWTHANIAAFGGDPERITLWGQSAGGGSVTAYSYAWPEDPKLAGLIADSGALSRASSSDTAQGNFTYLAGLVGCGEKSPEDELACMRTVPARDLENTLSNYIISQASPSLSFRPVVDEKTFFSNYTERTLAGAVAQIPLITGSNTNEGAGFVPFTPDGPGAEVLYNTTQNIIACPVAELAQIRGLGNLTTYRYLYAGNFSNISPLPWFGAYHSAELPMLFGTHYEYRANSTEYQWETANAMQALWVSFAQDPERGPVRISPGAATGEADGNPDGEVVFEWPQWQGGDELLVIAEGDTVFRIGAAEDVGFCRLDQ